MTAAAAGSAQEAAVAARLASPAAGPSNGAQQQHQPQDDDPMPAVGPTPAGSSGATPAAVPEPEPESAGDSGEDAAPPPGDADATAGEADEAAAEAADEAAEGEGGGSGGDGAPEREKRDYVRWSPQEEEAFYAALRAVAGQKPEVCLKEIVARVGTKDYAQVRHYYYRLIKRLNKILGAESKLDIKNPLQVHRAMIKFWEVMVDKGMRGTCMTGIMKKPRKKQELSTTVQRGVKAVMQRTKAQKAKAAGGGARKRKTRAGEAGGEANNAQGDAEMAEADAPPPPRQQRRTTGPSTRHQQMLALAEAAAAQQANAAAAGEGGSSQSHTGSPAQQRQPQPASSSQTAGSRQQDAAQLARPSAAHSFRSSGSIGGTSGAALEGSMGLGSCKLRLQLMPLDAATAQAMAAVGHHPFLELTLSTTKSLLSVLRHLGGKWQQAAAAAGAPSGSGSAASALYVHPPADCPITLRGVCWGGPECDGQLKVGDIYTTLHCPAPFQLLYSWAQPTSSTPAAAAVAPSPMATASKQTSSRATAQRQQSVAVAQAEQLTAELREAISAVAAAAVEPMPDAQEEQQPRALGGEQLGGEQEQPGSFMELLAGDEEMPMAASLGPAATPGGARAALAPQAGYAPSGFAMAVQPAPPFVPQPVPAGQLFQSILPPPPAAPPATARRPRGKKAAAAAEAASPGGTPDQVAQPAASMEAAAPATDPRKPRGLVGLLQTPADKVAKPKRQPAAQRKAPASVAKGGGRQKKKQAAASQQQQQVEQQQAQPYGLPAGFGPFMWAHMQPHMQQQQQQQQAVPVLQQQPPVLQQPQQVPILQQPLPMAQPAGAAGLAGQPRLPPELDFGGDSLFHLLDSHTAAGFSNLVPFSSPGKGEEPEQAGAVPPLPGSGGDFSLKSWPSLSPPPNFQLPDGFDTGLSPIRKQLGGHAPGAAGTLTGGARTAGAAPVGALDAALGPTDFSMLLAGMGGAGAGAAAAAPKQAVAAGVPPGALPPPQQPRVSQPSVPATALPADTLFGGLSLFGAPLGQPCAAAVGGGAAAAAPPGLPPLPDKELADLTFDFGSLLGVGDAPPSWLPVGGGGAQAQPQQPQQVAPLGERPFASLFGK